MKLTVYVLTEWDYGDDEFRNVKITIFPHEAREWSESDVNKAFSSRDFDTMQVEIPDDMVMEKSK